MQTMFHAAVLGSAGMFCFRGIKRNADPQSGKVAIPPPNAVSVIGWILIHFPKDTLICRAWQKA